MKKPVLVIMAAGMGSRYGGLKQIDPVDAKGRIIMDFSIFDAKRAGFEKVIFTLRKSRKTYSARQLATACQNTWKCLMHIRKSIIFRQVFRCRKDV